MKMEAIEYKLYPRIEVDQHMAIVRAWKSGEGWRSPLTPSGGIVENLAVLYGAGFRYLKFNCIDGVFCINQINK